MIEALRDWSFDEVYEASGANLVHDFYVPALNRTTHYDRAVGYFRSTIFHLVGIAISEFALRDGRMRVICSPSLSKDDEETIRKVGRTSDKQITNSIARDIEQAIQDVEEHAAIQLLATLLEHRILDLRLTFKPDKPGIFHTKVGIFSNGDDAVSFSGSANETYMAWAANEERFHTFCSWRSEYEARQIEMDMDYFSRLWQSKIPEFKTCRLPDTPRDLLRQYALDDPQAAIERVRLVQGWRSRVVVGNKARKWTLQKHQTDSRTNWWMEQRGIVCYVTGGGKTITALEIIRDWFRRNDRGAVLVVVPSDLLAKQWYRHLEAEEPQLTVLQVGGDDSNSKWRQILGDYTRATQVTRRRVVLAVMNSAATSDFVNRVQIGRHSLLIIDEVHKIGAPHFQRILQLQAGGRLGLSATPERFGDARGTEAIFDYFGARLEPEFTIRDAQQSNPPRLVAYAYHPEIVALTVHELAQYRKLSQRIGQLSAKANKSRDASDQSRLTLALIRRAKILKSAEGKTDLAREVINKHYEDGARWLVYCDDTAQLNLLRDALKEAGHRPLQYYSAMAFSKEATVDRFEKIGGILLSISCLDEGVDIPSITHALILASSVNPRQHLQRRGRVLRTAEGKIEATIFDTLVQPDLDRPRVLFDQDLDRAYEFSADADNGSAVRRRLSAFSPYLSDDAAPWIDFEEDSSDEEENR